MSLAFLFKKTWHPSTLQNSERVWIAEQKDAAEKRRIEELTKQVREEQQVRELEEMQAAGGHGPERKERIDWMYEGPMQSTQDQQAEANEYLMGKEFKMEDKGTSELKKMEETKAPGTLFTAAPATTANEAFRRVNEDPLLRMRKARMEAEQNVANNPVKMSKMMHQLQAELDARAEKKRAKKDAKKAKKEARKERKKQKKEKAKQQHQQHQQHQQKPDHMNGRGGGGGGGGGDDSGTHNDTAVSGPRGSRWGTQDGAANFETRGSRRVDADAAGAGGGGGIRRGQDEREHKHRDRRRNDQEREDGRREAVGRRQDNRRFEKSGGDDPRSSRGRGGERAGGGGGSPRRGRGADRQRGREGGEGGGGDLERGSTRREHTSVPGGRSTSWPSPARRERSSKDSKAEKCGQQQRKRSRSSSSSSSGSSSDGNRSPPKMKHAPAAAPDGRDGAADWGAAEGKRYGLVSGGGDRGGGCGGGGKSLGPAAALLDAKERERAERDKSRADARKRRVMSPEEKWRRLKEMEDDGVRNQELKKQRVEEGRLKGGGGEERGLASGGEGKSKPVFLDKMRGEQVDAMGLEERMKRNRHYQQRGADVHNFMERG